MWEVQQRVWVWCGRHCSGVDLHSLQPRRLQRVPDVAPVLPHILAELLPNGEHLPRAAELRQHQHQHLQLGNITDAPRQIKSTAVSTRKRLFRMSMQRFSMRPANTPKHDSTAVKARLSWGTSIRWQGTNENAADNQPSNGKVWQVLECASLKTLLGHLHVHTCMDQRFESVE